MLFCRMQSVIYAIKSIVFQLNGWFITSITSRYFGGYDYLRIPYTQCWFAPPLSANQISQGCISSVYTYASEVNIVTEPVLNGTKS